MKECLKKAIDVARRSKRFSGIEGNLFGRTVVKELTPDQIQDWYDNLVPYALSDPSIEFTDDEREIMIEAMTKEIKTSKFILRINLTNAEIKNLRQKAKQAGMHINDYVKRKILEDD